MRNRREVAERPMHADQEVVNAVVDAMDPVTLCLWKKAVDDKLKRAPETMEASRKRHAQ